MNGPHLLVVNRHYDCSTVHVMLLRRFFLLYIKKSYASMSMSNLERKDSLSIVTSLHLKTKCTSELSVY